MSALDTWVEKLDYFEGLATSPDGSVNFKIKTDIQECKRYILQYGKAKLEALQRAEAITSSADEKFELKHKINDLLGLLERANV